MRASRQWLLNGCWLLQPRRRAGPGRGFRKPPICFACGIADGCLPWEFRRAVMRRKGEARLTLRSPNRRLPARPVGGQPVRTGLEGTRLARGEPARASLNPRHGSKCADASLERPARLTPTHADGRWYDHHAPRHRELRRQPAPADVRLLRPRSTRPLALRPNGLWRLDVRVPGALAARQL